MESSNNIHKLPPSKRFKLLHHHQSVNEPNPDSPICLPAKKRVDPRPPISTTFCLPAKKRVWAPPPLSPLKPHQQEDKDNDAQPIKIPQVQEEEEEQQEDGVICAVCRSTDGDPSDPIVFCDGCDLMVHASCYGNPLIRSIPEGDWFCRRCEAKATGDDAPSCCLCPRREGALKPTTGGRWAHILCGLLVPEVFFRDPEGRDGIDCSRVPGRRGDVGCYLCGSKSGCSIECSEPKCGLGFHASCGVEEGLCIEYKEGRGGGGIVAGFCGEHTKLWKKQQLTGKFKIVAREDGSKRKNRR